jgi:hypothetical protein
MSEKALCRLLLAAFASAAAAATASAAEPQFYEVETSRDFLDGTLDAVSVDSRGQIRLAPHSRTLHEAEAPHLWVLAWDDEGTVYAGTGNEGHVLRYRDGEARVLFTAPELEVHALVVTPDGRLLAGTSPDGKVYEVSRDGNSEVLFDPGEKYIWGLAADAEGRVYVTTGVEGRLHRVAEDGAAEAILETSETHLTALAVAPNGTAYAGSSPAGIVYRVEADGEVFVLIDSDFREIKALALGADGSLYVAGIDGDRSPQPQPAPQPTPVLTTDVSVTVTATAEAAPAPTPAPQPAAQPTPVAAPGTTRGGVLRIHAGGEVERLWSSTEQMPHALVWTERGCLVGTGDKGEVFLVRDDQTWAMLTEYAAEQVTALVPAADGSVVLATSNPGKILVQQPAPTPLGTFVSKPMDTAAVSSWGRLRWRAIEPDGTRVAVATRSGNTGTPDATWSDWSEEYDDSEGSPISSPRARFLQVRAELRGADASSPTLESLSAAYMQRNLRPQVRGIVVHPPGLVFQKPLGIDAQGQILGLDAGQGAREPGAIGVTRQQLPPPTSFSRRLHRKGIQTISWTADDPNQDRLVYDVHYRALPDERYRLLRSGLEEAVLAWDTSTIPNGRYVVRITASDAHDNPHQIALTGSKESTPFEVDNTPPRVEARRGASGRHIEVSVDDDSSLVGYVEYSVNGGAWETVHPRDGICDSLHEEFWIELEELPGAGPHLFVVRASDRLGNLATAQVELP